MFSLKVETSVAQLLKICVFFLKNAADLISTTDPKSLGRQVLHNVPCPQSQIIIDIHIGLVPNAGTHPLMNLKMVRIHLFQAALLGSSKTNQDGPGIAS